MNRNSRPRCLIHSPFGPPSPADSLKFAVVSEEGLAYSGVWSVYPHSNRRRKDVFVTATGMNGTAKFSFHNDVLHHSWLNERFDDLVEQKIARPGDRHMTRTPIQSLPFHGLTVRFVDTLLRKVGQPLDHVKGTVVALPPPAPGMVLDVGFILAQGTELNINGAQFGIGEVGGGGRALVVVGRYSSQDTGSQKKEYNDIFSKIPVPAHAMEKISNGDQMAMLLFGQEGGAIIVTEVHNVEVVKHQ